VRFTDIESSCVSKSESHPVNYATVPQGGEGFFVLSPLPEREGWVRAFFYKKNPLPRLRRYFPQRGKI
jgi:hypothetical protein